MGVWELHIQTIIKKILAGHKTTHCGLIHENKLYNTQRIPDKSRPKETSYILKETTPDIPLKTLLSTSREDLSDTQINIIKELFKELNPASGQFEFNKLFIYDFKDNTSVELKEICKLLEEDESAGRVYA